ncbi:protein required for cell viability, putative [Talaromyces stipitatus ATCC 10500]|uniref:Protein required for cell viability, putative n=1 Tax=Talaromyces stipitatus (strain ATCC 10500 / CBS 375.48 / QM 6759 / NRRL 1006) TaxID=441959 RepID=B8MQ65_TALSN|nr:protein required for cell viability, putative [Talaromyces stipitatus ATCC 10500]EED13134.1 protein required for cell viability, putative [Talaromyces stipitatus ATCC 10500]
MRKVRDDKQPDCQGCIRRGRSIFTSHFRPRQANEFIPSIGANEIRKRAGSSIIEILSRDLSPSTDDDAQIRFSVIEEALRHLESINSALVSAVNVGNEAQQQPEDDREDAKGRRVIYTLLDLISIEGVYPCLSSGVGIPLEKRVISNLPTGVVARQAPEMTSNNPRNGVLLSRILLALTSILFRDAEGGIQALLRGRVLSDVISAAADLAFNSRQISEDERFSARKIFDRIITESSTSLLLPTLSSFLQPDAAPWFKAIISNRVSKIALRDDGVVHIIWFLASQFAPALGEGVSEPSPNGPPITVQAIMQISKLLSSVPQDTEPSYYFETIGSQLLALIDGEEPDLKRTAAYVVGSGILGKKTYGAPGTIGHSIFVEPLFKAMTASVDTNSSKWLHFFGPQGQDTVQSHTSSADTLVGESTLLLALDRLSIMALQHPNPGLVKRLVQPILLPLWGLMCFTEPKKNKKVIYDKCWALLQTFFTLSPGFPSYQKLTDNLLWDGGINWTYKEGTGGGVILVKRAESEFDIIRLLDELDLHADNFSKLLGCDPRSEDRTSDVFLHVSERWLVDASKQAVDAPNLLDNLQLDPRTESNAIVAKLVSAKIAEKLLSDFKDTLSKRPLKILELAQQIIQSELKAMNERDRRRRIRESGKVSLESLANIARPVDVQAASNEDDDQNTSETLSATFSLLSSILASPEFSMSRSLLPLLEDIKTQLDELRPTLTPALSKSSFTASMLLEIQIQSPDGTQQTNESAPQQNTDLDMHRQALKDITSPLPPVQAEGLSLLSKLISKSSPVLDIPSTMTLLLSIITGQTSETAASEEFIYLNAIKLIGQLASNHPRTVVKTLVDQYADKGEERTLDQRLKIGESLLRTVEDLGKALTGEAARTIGEGTISVASRRGSKPQTQKARREQVAKEAREKERKKRENSINLPDGWKVSSPALHVTPDIETLVPDNGDSDNETPEQAAHTANIISAWAAGAATDIEPDDIRVRASAISILASAIQTNLAGLGPSLASSAVDLALSTMRLETGPESAILRRASAVLLLDLIKAMDADMQNGSKKLGFGFSVDSSSSTDGLAPSLGPATIGNIPSILNTLTYVESRETDFVVRSHIRALVEDLETWMEKSLLWGINAQSSMSQDGDLRLGDRIAGLNINPLAASSSTQKPRIEEIE